MHSTRFVGTVLVAAHSPGKASRALQSAQPSQQGNGASVYRIVPYAAFHFYAYERYRDALAHSFRDHVGSSARLPPWMDLIAGSCAGATAVALTYPLDLVRTRLAWTTERVDPRTQRRHTIRSMAAKIHQEGGWRGVYRGISPTLIGVVPYAGLKFFTYQSLKGAWHTHAAARSTSSAPPAKPPLVMSLMFGGAAGLVGQTLTYPLDVVRRQMQVAGADPHACAADSSTWSSLCALYRRHGVAGLFKGLTINYMKVVPQTAVGFTVYDASKAFLGLENHL